MNESDDTPTFRLSLVVPMFNESEVCHQLFRRVIPILETLTSDFEIICVNDGSSDGTLARLREEHADEGRIKILDLTRNFGKEFALTAGLDFSSGDVVVPFDADLQDPPELIPEMVECWRQGFDVVLAIRTRRASDTKAKRVTADLFYRLMGMVGEIPLPKNAGDFRLMDRKVVDSLKLLPERTRFMKGIFAWLGYRQTECYYDRPARAAGETSWRYWKLWNFALDGVFSFTTLPLRIWSYLGVTISFIAIMYMIYVVTRTLVYGVEVPGYASLLAVLLFFNGLTILGLGILGEYIGRTFMEVKGRPLYIVRERVGFDFDSAAVPE